MKKITLAEAFKRLGEGKTVEESNPHTPGTFDWAEFEHSAGKTVYRSVWKNQYFMKPAHNWIDYLFKAVDFRATDWKSK